MKTRLFSNESYEITILPSSDTREFEGFQIKFKYSYDYDIKCLIHKLKKQESEEKQGVKLMINEDDTAYKLILTLAPISKETFEHNGDLCFRNTLAEINNILLTSLDSEKIKQRYEKYLRECKLDSAHIVKTSATPQNCRSGSAF